jgi:hypothetical protein
MLKVTQVKYLNNFSLWLSFDDGTSGTVDLHQHLNGPMFELLKDIEIFKQVHLDPELATIVWPNGVDLAPEFLKEHLH